ncbi:MAG: acyltransferase [Clostridium sp.]|nr:acyltransferase [Clostridium sp.]MCM1172816.1 acyltransferase [Clostridium sp.]MCM1208051.1 acyltransferase [Ruminococcus sp.]
MKTSFYSEEELQEIGLCTYGKNVLISRNAMIYGADKISIGDNVRIDDFCILSGNISLGSHIHIAAYCGLFGGEAGIIMEDFTTLSSRCAVYGVSDDYSGGSLTNPMLPDKFRNVTEGTVTIKKHSIIGTGSTILPDVTVGEGCSVGSMSLVNKSIEAWGIYAGIPCKRMKERKKDLLALEKEFLKEEKM